MSESFHLSFFKSKFDKKSSKEVEYSLSQIKALLSERKIIQNKSNAPAFNACKFGDKANEKGGFRHDKNVIELSCLILDYEHCNLSTTIKKWKKFQFFMYTSFSHSENDHRFRIVLPLQKPIPIAMYANLWKWAQKVAGDGLDPSKKNPSAIYFLPSSPSLNSLQEFSENLGALLDWEEVVETKKEYSENYGLVALSNELQNLRSAQVHNRNNQLNKSSFALGRLIGAGLLDRGLVASSLEAEATLIGLEKSEIKTTIESGITAGMANPTLPKLAKKVEEGLLPFLDARGNFKVCLQNALYLLDQANHTFAFSKNEFTQELLMNGKPITDDTLTNVVLFLERQTSGKRWTEDIADRCVKLLCAKSMFHPVKAKLESFIWDQIPRIDAFFEDIFQLKASEEMTAIARAFFSQLIRRIYQPGCQADCVLLLIGAQGIGKSSFCKIISLEKTWYRDAIVGNLGSKDACMALRGKWIIELSELAALRRSALEKIKNYLSVSIDQYRLPYGRVEIYQPRTCVFIGTTNEDQPLMDSTGARRFWPIHLKDRPRLDLLRANRDQYYAEALIYFKEGKNFWHDPSLILQESAFEMDEWEGVIQDFLENKEQTTILEIAEMALKIEIPYLDKAVQTRIGTCLQRLGWKGVLCWRGNARGQRIYTQIATP